MRNSVRIIGWEVSDQKRPPFLGEEHGWLGGRVHPLPDDPPQLRLLYSTVALEECSLSSYFRAYLNLTSFKAARPEDAALHACFFKNPKKFPDRTNKLDSL